MELFWARILKNHRNDHEHQHRSDLTRIFARVCSLHYSLMAQTGLCPAHLSNQTSPECNPAAILEHSQPLPTDTASNIQFPFCPAAKKAHSRSRCLIDLGTALMPIEHPKSATALLTARSRFHVDDFRVLQYSLLRDLCESLDQSSDLDYLSTGAYRLSCSGQSQGRLCSRHCVQTGLSL